MSTFIHGGTVVSPIGATPLDVLIDGERIVALLAPGDWHLHLDKTTAGSKAPQPLAAVLALACSTAPSQFQFGLYSSCGL